MTRSEPVYYERNGAIGRLVLNRPDQRNSMTPELLGAFARVADEAKADREARCIVVTGQGRCFSAGADLTSNLQAQDAGLPHQRSYGMYRPFLSLLDVEVPLLGALNGHAVGGGFGLALVCDIRIANRDAKYGANFARLGLHSGMAISYLLPRIVGVSNAAQMLFTGQLVKGTEAEAMGLVTRAVAQEEVLTETLKLAEEIAKSAPLVVRTMKRALYRGLGWDPKTAAELEAAIQAESLKTEDAAEGMAALLEKREPKFVGR